MADEKHEQAEKACSNCGRPESEHIRVQYVDPDTLSTPTVVLLCHKAVFRPMGKKAA